MTRAHYENRPPVYEQIAPALYAYRWDIQEEVVQDEQMENRIRYSCYEVFVYATVTANKILRSAIDAMWGNGVEEKLLNDYNASSLGISDNDGLEKYKQFLSERKTLKDLIDNDCSTLKIPMR